MPTRPPSPCATPGCDQLTERYRCPAHAVRIQRTSTIYNTRRWKILRARHLTLEPFCRHPDCHSLAGDVDHIVAIRDGGDPWDPANLQSLCRPHHAAKTAREVGLGHR